MVLGAVCGEFVVAQLPDRVLCQRRWRSGRGPLLHIESHGMTDWNRAFRLGLSAMVWRLARGFRAYSYCWPP
jgi:hypothetical protein